MVTIAKEAMGKSTISYRVNGGTEEYLAQLKAVTFALKEAPKETQAVLGSLLLDMLPDESQLNVEQNT